MKDTISKRIDAVTEIQTEYLGAVLPIPKSVKIELTSRCNFQCTFCANRHRDRHGLADMDWKLYTKVVNEMADAG